MKRYISTVLAAGMSLALVAAAQAAPRSTSPYTIVPPKAHAPFTATLTLGTHPTAPRNTGIAPWRQKFAPPINKQLGPTPQLPIFKPMPWGSGHQAQPGAVTSLVPFKGITPIHQAPLPSPVLPYFKPVAWGTGHSAMPGQDPLRPVVSPPVPAQYQTHPTFPSKIGPTPRLPYFAPAPGPGHEQGPFPILPFFEKSPR